MADRHILYKLLPALQGQFVANASDVEVDRTGLSTVQGNNTQAMATELERLFGIVRSLQDSRPPQERPLQVFTGAVSITPANLADYINRNAIYAAANDQRVNFVLPSEATIGNQYPAIFEIQHFGGTRRFDSGFTPTNTVVVTRPADYSASDPSTFLRRDSETGANLQFAELHRGDTAIIRKQDADSPWVIVEGSMDPRSSILPDGVFQMNSRGVSFPTNVNGDHVVGGLSLYTPNQGDAFEVIGSGITEESSFGRAIETGDVIVAKTDDPNLVLTSSNDDWLIIRDAGHGELTLRELRFLAQVMESDTNRDVRLISRSDVNAVRLWLSPYVLDHAPFITPTTDPNNPQSPNTTRYIGGDELQTSSAEFSADSNAVSSLTGETGSTIAPSALVYLDIDGSFSTDQLANVYMVIKDQDGIEITRHQVSTEFRPITLTGSSDTYYVFDDVSASDNFSSVNYHVGQEIDIIYRETDREFSFSDSVNVINSIKDGDITLSKLERNVQALITANTGISAVQTAKLAGLEDTTTSSPIPDHQEFYVKYQSASVSNALSDYTRVEQLNGILPDYERSTTYVLLVPKNISLTGLQKSENTATKNPVTPIGEIATTDGRSWIAYTATVPAITGANSIFDNTWELDGTVQNIVLSGANDTFKIDRANLSDDLADWITHQTPSTPSTYTLPDNLAQLSSHLTATLDTTSGWTKVNPSPVRASLTREFAALWDENRRTFTGNYFADKADVEVIGFTPNTIFYYNDPNDPLNTSFPSAQSYIYNDNVRIRNTGSGTNIGTGVNKIIGFDYALQRELQSSDNVSMLRVGGSSSTPMIGLSEQEGLYLNIGRGDGGQRTRTYDQSLQVDGGQWHDAVGQTTNAEAEVIIPDNITGSFTVKISIQLDSNGNDEGTHEETMTITNVASDQTIGQRTFSYTDVDGHSGTVTRNINFVYDAVNNDLDRPRRVLFVRPTTAFTNAALTYNVRASHSVTETWNVPTTFARQPINAGSGHDDFGLFDPHQYNTEHVRERNRVLLVVQKWRETDTSSDPEVAVTVIVDGELENSGNPIRLHRAASEFNFSDVNFGNNIVNTAHIQGYRYTGGVPSGTELQRMYSQGNNWLGAFLPPGQEAERFTLDAELEFTQDHFIILRSPNGTRYSVTLLDDGTVETKSLT